MTTSATTEIVKIGEISESDKALFAKARTAVESAQYNYQFVGQHLVDTYKVQPNQEIKPNGDIVEERAVAAEPIATDIPDNGEEGG